MSRSQAEDDRITGLALAARSGDQSALAGFITGTQRDVWRFLAHQAGLWVADDLTQETYLRALKAVRRFSGRSSARTWLLSIARRVVVDHIRHERSRPRAAHGVDWTAAADREQSVRSTGFEDVVELDVVLRDLDGDRREALLLTQVLGLSYQEAAEVCGCALGTIRSRVARARDELLGRGLRRPRARRKATPAASGTPGC
jgi:RNA polymerase sigma-70 factor (ECF subfamily)